MQNMNEMLGDATWTPIADRLLAVGQDKGSFTTVWIRIEPEIERWLRSPSFLGRVSDDEDHRREIIVRTWIKLQERENERVRVFVSTDLATSASPHVRARCWLRRVVKNLGIDYLRGLPEYVRRSAEAEASWRVLDVLDDELRATDSNPHVQIEAGQLLASLDEPALSQRSRERGLYRVVLEMWLAGHASAEIAGACELPAAADAERILGAAKELLRRRFRRDRSDQSSSVAARS